MIECSNVIGEEKNRSIIQGNDESQDGKGRRLKIRKSLDRWGSTGKTHLLWLVDKMTFGRKLE